MSKILLIEDDRRILTTIATTLSKRGFTVVQTSDGEKGLQLADKFLPHVIICDLRMPNFDGYAVLEGLKANPDTAMIPLICITAEDDRVRLRKVMELGAADYITKPFTIEELMGSVNAQLEKGQELNRYTFNHVENTIEILNNQIYYDSLTNLPNRILLKEKLQDLEQANAQVAFLLVWIDQFQKLRTSLGIDYVDLMMQTVVNRLKTRLPDLDVCLRLNGEHILLMQGVEADHQFQQNISLIIQAITKLMDEPIAVMNYETVITFSIGIADYPHDGTTIDELLNYAHFALVEASTYLGHSYAYYDQNSQAQSRDRLLIELDLRKAIIQNQFEIYYQPKIDVQTRDIIGAEALLRWFHPQKGFISPGIFIPIAEESGLITTIDAWILDQVCQQIKSWQAENIFVSIAVNLSGVNFQDVGLCDRVATILQRHHIDPQYIELEVTETALIQNPEQTGKILQQLKNLGIKLALDDFGTGYSSLNYLRNFPFDHIKLDRSFVERVDEQTKNATILNAMILLAHGLDLHVVGEGVEREAEYDFLKQNHCDALQGYLFSPPVNVHEFKKLLLKVIPVNIEPSLTHQLTHQLIGSTDAQCHGQ